MIGSGGLGFRGGNRPTNLQVLDSDSGDPRPTTRAIGSGDGRFITERVGWVPRWLGHP